MYFRSEEDNPRKRIIVAVQTRHRHTTINACKKELSGNNLKQMKAIIPDIDATINALKTTLFK